jgi:hypothetical protein
VQKPTWVRCWPPHSRVDSTVRGSGDLHLMSCFATSVVRFEMSKKKSRNQDGYVVTKRVLFGSRLPPPNALTATVIATTIFDGTWHCVWEMVAMPGLVLAHCDARQVVGADVPSCEVCRGEGCFLPAPTGGPPPAWSPLLIVLELWSERKAERSRSPWRTVDANQRNEGLSGRSERNLWRAHLCRPSH